MTAFDSGIIDDLAACGFPAKELSRLKVPDIERLHSKLTSDVVLWQCRIALPSAQFPAVAADIITGLRAMTVEERALLRARIMGCNS